MQKKNNKHGQDGRTGSRRGKPNLALLVGGTLFGLCFLLAGVLIGLRPLGQMLHAAWEVRSWRPTPIEVLETRLEEHTGSEGDTVHAVRARYRYQFAGQTYEAERVGLDKGMGSDNLGDWHQRWHERLQAAREGGPQLLAWVDPVRPDRAVLDREIRWPLLLLMTPFALVFPLVGLAALGASWRALRTRNEAAGDDAASAGQALGGAAAESALTTGEQTPRRRALFHWFIALFWCGIAFPLAGIFLGSRAPIWLWLFCSVFVAVGLALLWEALRQTRLAWHFGGSRLRLRPARPRAGQRLELELQLSRRAATAWRGHGLPRLCLSQFRVDESSSGSPEREVQCLEQAPRLLDLGPAGLRLQASFELPGDAPTAGSQRSGERVDWRLSLRNARGRTVLDFSVPVQADEQARIRSQAVPEEQPSEEARTRPGGPASGLAAASRAPAPDPAPDRFARRAGPAPDQPIPAAASDERRPELPPGVRWTEGRDASALAFAQKGWRWTGLLALLLFGGLALAGRGDEDAGLSGALLGQAVLLTLGLHGLSRRWTLQIRDDGVLLQRRSWIWASRTAMPASALDPLYHRLQYSRQQAGWSEEFHALYTRWPGRGHGTRLSPALPGSQGAEALAQFLRWAAAQRRGRFSAGALREKWAARSGPAWGLALVPLLLWLLQRN